MRVQRRHTFSQIRGASRLGFTLPEVVVALAISSIIVISLNSTLTLAVRSVPSVNSEVQRDIEFSRILRQIETEAETCLRVLHASMDSFSIIVADRDGDANPEKIRYFTAGTGIKSLYRQYNSDEPEFLFDDLADLAVSFEEQNLTIDLPSTFTTGSQELLASQSPFLSVSNSIDSINSVGQSLLPSNPAGEVWRPTSIRLRIRRESSGSSVNIELYPAIDDGTPASNRLLLNSAPFAGSSIPSSYSDGYLVFNPSDVPWTKSSNRFAVTAEIAAGASSVSYARSGLGNDMLYEAGSWNRSSYFGLDYQLYGQRASSNGKINAIMPVYTKLQMRGKTSVQSANLFGSCNLQNCPGNSMRSSFSLSTRRLLAAIVTLMEWPTGYSRPELPSIRTR